MEKNSLLWIWNLIMKRFPKIYFIFIVASSVVLFMLCLIAANMDVIISYIVSINVIAFVLYGYDKMISNTDKTRVPEVVLHLVSLVGGSLAALFAQNLFRHKINKYKFKLIFWFIVFIQAVLIWFVFYKIDLLGLW